MSLEYELTLHSYYNYYSKHTLWLLLLQILNPYFKILPLGNYFTFFPWLVNKFNFIPAFNCTTWQLVIVPPVVRVSQFEKGWFRLHVQVIQNRICLTFTNSAAATFVRSLTLYIHVLQLFDCYCHCGICSLDTGIMRRGGSHKSVVVVVGEGGGDRLHSCGEKFSLSLSCLNSISDMAGLTGFSVYERHGRRFMQWR